MGTRGTLTVVALVLLAGCSSSDAEPTTTEPSTTTEATTTTTEPTTTAAVESATAALTRQFQYLSDGQFGRAYTEIHPAQQALFTADQYTACLSTGPSIDVTGVEVVEEYLETITVPGTDVSVDSTAITAKVTANGQTSTDTYHEVMVDGRWVFTVSDFDMTDC